MIYNQSIQSGCVPQDWRDADVNPLFKKGARLACSNYRPISLTSHIVKLLERIILSHILELSRKNNTFSCDQHGFQEKCSCISQLLECLNDWSQAFDEGHSVVCIYLDFAKAFDSVPHQCLILKLRQVGIRGKIIEWIQEYLNHTRQRVILKNSVSQWLPVTSGVPQGSILGPILFLIYVNDLPDYVSNTTKMFADDTKAYSTIDSKDDCHILQKDLNNLASWSRTWLLHFNAPKCVVLRIRQSIQCTYTLNGIVLEAVANQKDLGVIVSDDLTPGAHISHITKKCNQRIGLIKRCFTNLSADKVKILYQSLIRPVLGMDLLCVHGIRKI